MKVPLHRFCRLLCGIVLALFFQAACADGREQREALDRRYVSDIFRIYYTAEGANAFVGRMAGSATSGELAQRLGKQLDHGYRFYSGVVGLIPPFANPRYRNVNAIDVHVVDLGGKNGSAGDTPFVYRYRNFDDSIPALTISISSHWKPGNLTPEHEVFHAFQYGYTFFKNGWFLEGQARSIGSAFDGQGFQSAPLPRNAIELRQLLTRTADAAPFWNRLMLLCDQACPVSWSGTSYHPKVRICGDRFLKSSLEEFQKIDKEAAQARGINPNDWPEREQRSEVNNFWLLRGLARTMEKQCPIASDAELRSFYSLLGEQGQ